MRCFPPKNPGRNKNGSKCSRFPLMRCIQEYLEQHSAALMADGKNLNCICLD